MNQTKNSTLATYLVSIIIGMLALSYAAVPLYRLFCSVTGLGGVAEIVDVKEAAPNDVYRVVKIKFNIDVNEDLHWKCQAVQNEVQVNVGETSLAFFNATNFSRTEETGISTYNITPIKAGAYFNKIQCFCFEEQELGPNQSVDFPVLFYIDPDFATDEKMNDVETITLSYTFFKAK